MVSGPNLACIRFDMTTFTVEGQEYQSRRPGRAEEFVAIARALGASVVGQTADSVVAMGDSLHLLEQLPDRSVSLILCDPPYHSTRKANIKGDRAFAEDEHFLHWIEMFASQWQRVLKLSGTLYVFCSSQMSARLEVMLASFFRPISHIVWTKPNDPGYDGWKGKMRKESLRSWYPHSERILMFEHGTYGSLEAYRRSPMGEYLLACRHASGMSMIELTERIGEYGAINRGGAVANWEAGRNVPSREQYSKVVSVLEGTGNVGRMLEYDDIVRPMHVNKDVEFTDVWNFMSVRPFRGKHPAEKPQEMLMHMIQASSLPGDVVLDCFCGSGSTGVAAVRLGRRTVCIDIDERWVSRAIVEVGSARQEGQHEAVERVHHASRRGLPAQRLFD